MAGKTDRYGYYPGCSLTGAAREYDVSTRTLFSALGVGLSEIEGWTCCGATAAETVSRPLALSLSARNLALAEKDGDARDILIPCSACYLNLKKAQSAFLGSSDDARMIRDILSGCGLSMEGAARPRHILDILANDVGAAEIESRVAQPLSGLAVAPYYGCQCLRPFAEFDDPEAPETMAPLIAATGARVFEWEMGAVCCGASHMTTKPEVGTKRITAILQAAQGADAIVTVCPMCQINLEAWQGKISRASGIDVRTTVLYLPQLLGLAVGLTPDQTRLGLNLAVTEPFLAFTA